MSLHSPDRDPEHQDLNDDVFVTPEGARRERLIAAHSSPADRRRQKRRFWLRTIAVTLAVSAAVLGLLWVRHQAAEWSLPWLDVLPGFLLNHPMLPALASIFVGAVWMMLLNKVPLLRSHISWLNIWVWVVIVTYVLGIVVFALAPAAPSMAPGIYAPERLGL